jgi:NDP-sugar pyrophosphorylase family protein
VPKNTAVKALAVKPRDSLILNHTMQIIIPLSGAGQRFANAGYKEIKPLIQVQGKHIIEYVVDLFPGEHDFIFVCRKDHLEETPLEKILMKKAPFGRIVSIEPHKLGPVHAVLQASNIIHDDEPAIVNYCDFFMKWDYPDFKKWAFSSRCAGAIPCYTGFHPHLLKPENVYAGCRVDTDNKLVEIREKYGFEADKTSGHHSAGTYYFQSGALIKKYFSRMVEQNLHLNGEFYVSMVYQLLLEDNLPVMVYDKIPHFCQWGTPADLQEYLWWGEVFGTWRTREELVTGNR